MGLPLKKCVFMPTALSQEVLRFARLTAFNTISGCEAINMMSFHASGGKQCPFNKNAPWKHMHLEWVIWRSLCTVGKQEMLSCLYRKFHYGDKTYLNFLASYLHNEIACTGNWHQCVQLGTSKSINILYTIKHHIYRSALLQVMTLCLTDTEPMPETVLIYCQSDSREQTSLKTKSRYQTFH